MQRLRRAPRAPQQGPRQPAACGGGVSPHAGAARAPAGVLLPGALVRGRQRRRRGALRVRQPSVRHSYDQRAVATRPPTTAEGCRCCPLSSSTHRFCRSLLVHICCLRSGFGSCNFRLPSSGAHPQRAVLCCFAARTRIVVPASAQCGPDYAIACTFTVFCGSERKVTVHAACRGHHPLPVCGVLLATVLITAPVTRHFMLGQCGRPTAQRSSPARGTGPRTRAARC